MRFKKPRVVLFGISFAIFAIAVALFFVVPMICGEGFQYNGVSALLSGLKALVSFNFANVIYTAIAVLFVVAVAVMIIFAVTLIQKKHKKHLFAWFISLIIVLGSFVFASIFFLADIEFNGVSGKFIESMLKVDGQILGKVLSSVSIAFVLISNILIFVYMFVVMISITISKQIDDLKQKMDTEKEEQINSKVAEVTATLNAKAEADAAIAADWLKAKYVIPIHYNTWPVIAQDVEAYKADVEAKTSSKVIIVKPGETITLE